MSNPEESKERLPHWGTTRGKTIFRYSHQQKTKPNEAYWTCNYVLMPGNTPQTDDAARALAITQIRAEAKYQIEGVAGFPQWFQANVANGIYPSAVGDIMKAHIAATIAESNRCEDLITSAATISEALEVIPAWPEV